jgi:hypothetical protein
MTAFIGRREFITVLGGAAATTARPIAALAQQPTKVARIGFVGATTAADTLPKRVGAFRAGLRELGYQEGRDRHRAPLGE